MKARLALLTLAAAVSSAQTPAPRAESAAGFSAIPTIVEAAISRHELPGAVVLAGRGDAAGERGNEQRGKHSAGWMKTVMHAIPPEIQSQAR